VAVRGWNTFCSSCTCIHRRRQQQGWRTLATGALTRRSTGVQWAACTPRFAVTVRAEVHCSSSRNKAAAFEHQLKTIGKVTDG
jgi:hypothetical protein